MGRFDRWLARLLSVAYPIVQVLAEKELARFLDSGKSSLLYKYAMIDQINSRETSSLFLA